jgi:hypothetical protein
MTGWRVGRFARTTRQPREVRPAGGSTLMPPPSQGAERRPERPAARSGSRWGLRVLVVSGLAGTAWLLAGAAAHAADHDPAVRGSSPGSAPIGSVRSGDTAHPMGAGILQAADQPLESGDHPDLQYYAGARIRQRYPAPAVVEDARGRGGDTGATGAARDLTAATRLTGGQSDPAAFAPVQQDLAGPGAARPAVQQHTARPYLVRPWTSVPYVPQPRKTGPAAVEQHHQAKPHEFDEAKPQSFSARHRIHQGKTHRHRAGQAERPGTAPLEVPGELPAPLQSQFGATGSVPAAGSGAPTEGSSAAVLPAAVGVQAVASHRLPPVADVEVRHQYAGAPNVQPD